MTIKTKTTGTSRWDRFEGVVQVVILLGVAGMAGAASFTHVHDWTLRNSPPGTGGWFGWANAMVSELIPLAAALELRRRRRRATPTGRYPVLLILAAVALSLAGQFAEAKPGLSGWLISAVPALGFLALVKLVLSSPATPPAPAGTASAASTVGELVEYVDEHDAAPAAPAAAVTTNPNPAATLPHGPAPATPAVTGEHLPIGAATVTHLLPAARYAVAQHRQQTGRQISPDELATRMNLAPGLARQLLADITEPIPRLNGATVTVPSNIR